MLNIDPLTGRDRVFSAPVEVSPVSAEPAASARPSTPAPVTIEDIAKGFGENIARATPQRLQALKGIADRINAESQVTTTAAAPTAPVAPPAPAAQPSVAEIANPKAEYYRPTGRATNGRVVPTPKELGFGIEGDPDSSATLRVAGSENEKAFNIADYLFNNGIRSPEILDQIPTDEDFMEAARLHGQSVGNAVPKNAYATTLHGKTLDLAKAHLAKMGEDEENGIPPKYAPKTEPDDFSDALQQSIANLGAKP